MVVKYKNWNSFCKSFLPCFIFAVDELNIKVCLGAVLSLALYSTVCCQNLVTKSLTTFKRERSHSACHLSDIWFYLEIVEVLIVPIADYTDCGMSVVIGNYVRSILNIPINN